MLIGQTKKDCTNREKAPSLAGIIMAESLKEAVRISAQMLRQEMRCSFHRHVPADMFETMSSRAAYSKYVRGTGGNIRFIIDYAILCYPGGIYGQNCC